MPLSAVFCALLRGFFFSFKCTPCAENSGSKALGGSVWQDVTYCGHSRAVFAEGKMPARQMYIFLSVFSVYHDTGDDKRPGKHLHNRICLPGLSDLYNSSGHIHPVYFSALIRISHCSRCWSPFRSAGPDRCLLALIFRMIWACLMFSWRISG